MIILEGSDGTGKTTLAKKIAKKLNMEYLKIPRHKGDIEIDGFKFYTNLAESIPDNSVVDRFHLGEYVYPKLYADDLRYPLKMWQQHAIERVLQARGCLLINVIANYDFIINTYKSRNDNFNITDIKKENDLFAECSFNSLLMKKTFITTHTNEELFIEFVKIFHNMLQKEVEPIRKYNSTGSIHYPIMIVGSKIPKLKYSYNSSFGYCAYLHQALDISGCKNNYYITSSDNIGDILKENYIINPIFRIALGNNAHELLDKAGLPHSVIKHPLNHQTDINDVYAYAHCFSEVIV